MIREAINELKKYTLGKKNTEKVEISVLMLNRVIKALEKEPSLRLSQASLMALVIFAEISSKSSSSFIMLSLLLIAAC